MENGALTQMTNFIQGDQALKTPESSPQNKWVAEEEMSLFDVLRTRNEKNERNEALQNSLKPKRPLEIPLNGQVLKSMVISPDEKFIIYCLVNQTSQGYDTKIPIYISEIDIDEKDDLRSPNWIRRRAALRPVYKATVLGKAKTDV